MTAVVARSALNKVLDAGRSMNEKVIAKARSLTRRNSIQRNRNCNRCSWGVPHCRRSHRDHSPVRQPSFQPLWNQLLLKTMLSAKSGTETVPLTAALWKAARLRMSLLLQACFVDWFQLMFVKLVLLENYSYIKL